MGLETDSVTLSIFSSQAVTELTPIQQYSPHLSLRRMSENLSKKLWPSLLLGIIIIYNIILLYYFVLYYIFAILGWFSTEANPDTMIFYEIKWERNMGMGEEK